MTMERMAPDWITTSKVFMISSLVRPSSELARMRCPVDETGRNSVRPSTMPMTAALINSNASTLGDSGRPRARNTAAAVQSAQSYAARLAPGWGKGSLRAGADRHLDALARHPHRPGRQVQPLHLVGQVGLHLVEGQVLQHLLGHERADALRRAVQAV